LSGTHDEGPFRGAVRGVKLSPDGKLALVGFVYWGRGSTDPAREPVKVFDLLKG
jgi:hypothetical protein